MKKRNMRIIAAILPAILLFTGLPVYSYAEEANAIISEVSGEEVPEADTEIDSMEETSTESYSDIASETAVATDTEETSSTEDESVTEETTTAEETTATEETLTEEVIDYSQAEKEFATIANDKILMALIYMDDSVKIYDSVDVDPVDSKKVIYGSCVADLESGYTVYIHGVKILNNKPFYNISFFVDCNEKYGYVSGYYLAHSDEDWIGWEEKYITADEEVNLEAYDDIAKFPGYMQDKLTAIKRSHPNWVFVPQNTNLDFNTAVANEGKDNRSWIQKTTTNENAGYLGAPASQSGWCLATPKAIAFYMNPYNYMDDTRIFAFEQLTYNASFHTEAAIQTMLKDTFMRGDIPKENMTYAHAFYEIGSTKKLSPFHLASRVIQEQGSGTSPLISGTYSGYVGYYNYFNVGATGSNPVITGLEYAKKMGWNTRYKSLNGGASTISTNYILKGQDTIYLQKFNVAPGAANATYTHQYMQNIQAPWSESYTTKKSYTNAGIVNSAFVFKIPIYNNAPESVYDIPITEIRIVDEKGNKLEKLELLTGQSVNLDLRFEPRDATEVAEATWKSTNPAVVSVENGKVTALKADGNINTITASMGKDKPVTTTVKVTVSDCVVRFYKADGTTLIKTIKASYGQTLTASDFPALSTLGQSNKDAVFEGFYSSTKGGTEYTEGTAIYTQTVSIYPKYFIKGKGFYTSAISDQTYTGSAIKPQITVYDSYTYKENGINALYHEPLIQGVDYTVTYKNNKFVGRADNENTALRPTIIIKGKGNYSGQQEVYFNIVPKSLYDADISVDNLLVSYTGKPVLGQPVVYRDGKKLKLNTDYVISYPAGINNYTRPGVWPLAVEGRGGYTGRIALYETITSDVLMSKVAVKPIPAQTYDGKEKTPPIIATYSGKTLIQSTDGGKTGDYEVVYGDNISIGTCSVTIKAVNGSGFRGSKTISFKINGQPITKAKVRAKNTSLNLSPTGIDNKTYSSNAGDMLQNNYELYIGDYVLRERTDYTVSYLKETTVGTASIIFTGINGYSGTLRKNYRILPLDLTSSQADSAVKVYMPVDKSLGDTVESGCPTFVYEGSTYYQSSSVCYAYRKGGVKPKPVVVYNGEVLTFGTDYALVNARNVVQNDGSNPLNLPQLTVRGKGRFKNNIIVNYTIGPRSFTSITKANANNISAPDVTYNTRKNGFKSIPIITDVTGTKLSRNVDYERDFTYTYTEPTDLDGDGKVDRLAGSIVQDTDILPVNTSVTVTATGKGNYSAETISCTYRIIQMPISSGTIKAKIAPMDYTGRQIKPDKADIDITLKGVPLNPTDYKIISYGDNIKKGPGTVVIAGKGNYGGTRTITFSIKSKLFSWL